MSTPRRGRTKRPVTLAELWRPGNCGSCGATAVPAMRVTTVEGLTVALCTVCLQVALRVQLNRMHPPHPTKLIELADGTVGFEGYCETHRPRPTWVERRPGERRMKCGDCLLPFSGSIW